MNMLLDYPAIAPDAIKSMVGMNNYSDQCSIPQNLRRLMEIIVSRLNGCSYCIIVHEKQARELGEGADRIEALEQWAESPLFDAGEKLAFEWAVNITSLKSTNERDRIFAELQEFYSDKEIVDLAFIATAMNAWNRIAISFRHEAP